MTNAPEVVLGVTGSIGAYKSGDLVRLLRDAGYGVTCVMTQRATRFIAPTTLQTLSERKTYTDLFDSDETHVAHTALADRARVVVVAPATANILAKFARGVADDLLSTFYTAVTAPVVLAPAMNTRMGLHPATQENLAILRNRGNRIVEPESGWLAEGEIGWGRLAEPGRIVEAALAAARRSRQLHGKTIVVTAGPTRESVDPVRFLSNRSSGKMGYAIAAAAARRGASVVLVSGPVDLPVPYGVEVIRVTTGAEMQDATLQACRGADALFMAAAVSDYVPVPRGSKIKKTGGPLLLTLEEGPDILSAIAREKGDLLVVGFAAETENLLANAREKLARKGLDFIVANDVSSARVGIDSDRNAVTVLDRRGGEHTVPEASKGEVAEALLDRIFGEGG